MKITEHKVIENWKYLLNLRFYSCGVKYQRLRFIYLTLTVFEIAILGMQGELNHCDKLPCSSKI